MSNRGRRGKYHKWITSDGLTTLEGWARDGLTDEQIAHNIGIARGTLYEWKNRFPNIDDALKRGKEVVDIEVENKLLKRALGFEYVEEKVYQEKVGDQTKVRKEIFTRHALPDTTAQIFWLKNRKPEQWRAVTEAVEARMEAETRRAQAEAELAEYKARAESKSKEPMEVIIVDDLKDVMNNASSKEAKGISDK